MDPCFELTKIIELSTTPTLIINTKANSYQVMAANHAFQNEFGKDPNKIVGKGYFDQFDFGKTESILKLQFNQLCKTLLPNVLENSTLDFLNKEANSTQNNCWDIENVPISNESGELGYIVQQFHNITEKEAIKNENVLLKTFVNSQNETVFFAVDKNFNYTFINEYYKSMMYKNYGVEIKIGTNLIDNICFNDDIELTKMNLQRVFDGDNFTVVQKFVELTKSYFETSYHAIENNTGEIIGATVVACNLAQRMLTVKEHQETVINYRELVENSPDAFAIFIDGIIVVANQACANLLKAKSKEDLIGEIVFSFIHPDSKQDVMNRMQELSVKGIDLNPLNEKCICLDGSIMEIEVRATAIIFEGKPAVRIFIKDINENKKLAKKIELNESFFKLLTEGVDDVVWTQDKNNVFTYISPADERLRGFKAEEVIGKHVFHVLTDEGINAVKNAIFERTQLEKSGKVNTPINIIAQEICKDGRLIWAEIISSPVLDAMGEIIGFRGISRDITHRKQYADLLSEKIKELERFQKFVVDRELKMIELKKEINELLSELKREAKYKIAE